MSDMNRQNTDTGAAQDVKDIMRKYDRESNTRIWEGRLFSFISLRTSAFKS